jgi:hypothetical protein
MICTLVHTVFVGDLTSDKRSPRRFVFETNEFSVNTHLSSGISSSHNEREEDFIPREKKEVKSFGSLCRKPNTKIKG